MKKTYINPTLTIVQLAPETCILSGSGKQFDVNISGETMKGSSALSNGKSEIWNNEGLWK